MLPEQIQLSVVIPVYHAAEILDELHRRIQETLKGLGITYEIILVDDASKDNSWGKIVELAKQDAHVRGFKLSRNFGQHHALTAGLDFAQGDKVLFMDCDLQDRPEDIPLLLEKHNEGFDVVIVKWKNRNDIIPKKITAIMFYGILSWFMGYRYDPGIRSFRILSRIAADALKSMREQMRSIGPMSSWLGFDTAYLEIERSIRASGASSYDWRKLFKLASTLIISSSDKPLKISIWVGFFMAFTSFVLGGYLFVRALVLDVSAMGWSSLIVSLYFIGGLVLINLGVIGVYLGKVLDETKSRPIYVVAKTTERLL